MIIKREECTNGVPKIIGRALLSLKLGGRKTAITVKKLENYFTQVIMKNIRDMEAIKRGIYATLRHCAN